MKVFYLQIVILFAVGCVSPLDDGEPFADFDEAEEVECYSWPKDEQTLGIYDVVQSQKHPAAFIAQVRRRNNSIQFHHRLLGAGQTNAEDAKTVSLPTDAHMLGMVEFGKGGAHFAIINPQNGYRLEIRSQPDHGLVYQDVRERKPSLNEKLLADGTNGFWLVYQTEHDENEVGNVEYYRLQENRLGLDVVRVEGFQTMPDKDMQVVLDQSLYSFFPMENSTRAWIEYQGLDREGKPGKRVDLPIPLSRRVDKWAALVSGNAVYLAVIDGESYLRQANLKVAKLQYENGVLKPTWLKSRSLMNFHVSAPIWMQSKSSISVLVPKWLDGKSTIARYQVTADGVTGAGHVGQFPKAARLTAAFSGSTEGGDFIVVRTKDKVGWNFSVCSTEASQ